jgi:hypothetical protein
MLRTVSIGLLSPVGQHPTPSVAQVAGPGVGGQALPPGPNFAQWADPLQGNGGAAGGATGGAAGGAALVSVDDADEELSDVEMHQRLR